MSFHFLVILDPLPPYLNSHVKIENDGDRYEILSDVQVSLRKMHVVHWVFTSAEVIVCGWTTRLEAHECAVEDTQKRNEGKEKVVPK